MKLLRKDDLDCAILLEEEESDSSEIKSIAKAGGFRKQTKRHITILSGSTRIMLLDILNKFDTEERENIKKEINNILESLEWKYTPTEIYRIKKTGYIDNPSILENRQSYIMMIKMPDMKIFYKRLNSLLKANLPIQVPHITLFTKGERENPIFYGIPIPSVEEFNALNPKKIS